MAMRREFDFKVIGNNLKKFRESKNLSVEDVKDYMMLGCVQTVYKWERGESLPQTDSLMALLELYEVNDVRSVYTEEGPELSSDDFWIR